MSKQKSTMATELNPPIRLPSEKQMLSEKLKNQGIDCTVDSGVIRFYVGLHRENEIRRILRENDYRASWGIYPERQPDS